MKVFSFEIFLDAVVLDVRVASFATNFDLVEVACNNVTAKMKT